MSYGGRVNDSGFHGINIATLYPDMGSGISQVMTTTPDPDEIESLSAQTPDAKVRPAVNPATKMGLWILIAFIVAYVFLAGRG